MNSKNTNLTRGLLVMLRFALTMITGVVAIAINGGCTHHAGEQPVVLAPPMAEPEQPERVDMNRTAAGLALPDRTTYSVDDAVARARLAEEKGTIGELRMAASILKPFGPESRRWHGEDQARVARHQIIVGLAAADEACIRSGISNLVAAKPAIRGVIYENEITLLYAAHARLGWQRPDASPTRLTSAMSLYASPRNSRRLLSELKFVDLRGGNAASQADFERQVQESLFEFLGAWAKGEATNESLQELLQVAAMAEYRGFRVYLPVGFTDADTLAVRLFASVFRDLGAEI